MFGLLPQLAVVQAVTPQLQIHGFSQAQAIDDSTQLFQDAFDGIEATPVDLLPQTTERKRSSIEVPPESLQYRWIELCPEHKKPIRLAKFERAERHLSNAIPIQCELLQTGLPLPQLKCEITTADLDCRPEYVAISYTWLDMEADVPLLINDKEILNVNASLFACLQHLLMNQTEITLWWDNICVCQTDEDEISRQVALMKDIYGRSKRTYIWLGENDGDSKLALQALNEICPLSTKDEGLVGNSELARRAEGLVGGGLRNPDSETSQRRKAIARLLNRKYFERAWIYQEAAVSKEIVVLVGDQEISFDRLCLAVDAYCAAESDSMRRTKMSLGNPLSIVAHGYHTLQAIRQVRKEHLEKRSLDPQHLQTILCRVAGNVRAKREHDLVYAFLSFQDRVGGKLVKVDYKMSVGAAYNDAAFALMKATHNLDLLGICGGERTSDLATWAPNWANRLPQGQPIYQSGIESLFNACKGMKFKVDDNLQPAPTQLVVRGRIVDTVAAVHDFTFKYAERNTLGIDHYLNLQGHVDFLNRHSHGGQPQGPARRLRVLRALLADGAYVHSGQIFKQETVVHKKFSDAFLTSLLEAYDHDSALRQYKSGTTERLDQMKDKYAVLRNKSLICVRKRIFYSENGSLGLAPKAIEEKDVVCILHGSRVPVILRRSEGDGGQVAYTLVGQAYLEGAMYGEKVDWLDDTRAKEFVLV